MGMDSIPSEIWKDVPEYEGLYQVSNHGRVKSLKFRNNQTEIERERIIIPCVKDNGYLYVGLSRNGIRHNKYIHRLVAEVFLENPDKKNVVNHIDYDVTNNRVENLEWCTQKENVRYSAHKMRHPRKYKTSASSGEKYIRFRDGRYHIGICRMGIPKVYKSFSTLEEAIKYRDDILGGGL